MIRCSMAIFHLYMRKLSKDSNLVASITIKGFPEAIAAFCQSCPVSIEYFVFVTVYMTCTKNDHYVIFYLVVYINFYNILGLLLYQILNVHILFVSFLVRNC